MGSSLGLKMSINLDFYLSTPAFGIINQDNINYTIVDYVWYGEMG